MLGMTKNQLIFTLIFAVAWSIPATINHIPFYVTVLVGMIFGMWLVRNVH